MNVNHFGNCAAKIREYIKIPPMVEIINNDLIIASLDMMHQFG